MRLSIATVCFLSVSSSGARATPGTDSCPPPRVKNAAAAAAEDCLEIALPPGFCTSCRMSALNEDGQFPNCRETMNLTDTCLDALQDYVDTNPCDTKRATHLENFRDGGGRTRVQENAHASLDWFAFSICDQGCDCRSQAAAHRSTPSVDFRRGTCQDHTLRNICKLLPNIKAVHRLGDESVPMSDGVNALPLVCNLVRDWHRNWQGIDWVANPYTTVDANVSYFLGGFTNATQLLELEDYWNQCLNLEIGQDSVMNEETNDTAEVVMPPRVIDSTTSPIHMQEDRNVPPLVVSSSETTSTEAASPRNEYNFPAVSSFSLMQANTTDTVLIERMVDGSIIDVGTLGTGQLAIRANAEVQAAPVGSVCFQLDQDDNSTKKTENAEPYSLTGDANGSFNPWIYQLGKEYTIKAIPYAESYCMGTKGLSMAVRFSFARPPPPEKQAASDTPTERSSISPTTQPTRAPTVTPTGSPTSSPTVTPTGSPTSSQTVALTGSPTSSLTELPTSMPTSGPTESSTVTPAFGPTKVPTASPTSIPTVFPTLLPTNSPTKVPTLSPMESMAPGSEGNLTLLSIENFTMVQGGELVEYYVDDDRKALAINAAKQKNRGKNASAETTYDGNNGTFTIVLTALTETDGECTYTILVNGKEIGSAQNPETDIDYLPVDHLWDNVALKQGDNIQVKFNSVSNDKIPEGNGFAFARGRWTALTIVGAGSVSRT